MSTPDAHAATLDARAAVLVGGYRLERILGEGGMGVVWAARSPTGEPVAVKLLRGEATDEGDRRRLLREARAAGAVAHPNVVKILEVLEFDDGDPALVMERLEGESLATRLGREGALPIEEAIVILRPVLGAVGAAHARGVIHRDLKPANIFLARDGGGAMTVKVLDFGIAKLAPAVAAETGSTTTGRILGTPAYMAPEQIFGDRDLDHRVDIWALGLVFHECLTGELPTVGENVGQTLKAILTQPIPPIEDRVPDISPALAAIVNRMVSRDRDARPRTIAEIEGVIARCAGAPPWPAPSDTVEIDAVSAQGPPPTASGAAVDTAAPYTQPVVDPPLAPPLPSRSRGRWRIPLLLGTTLVLGASLTVALFVRRPSSPPPSLCGDAIACLGTDVPDPDHVDPQEILPRVQKIARDIDRSAGLVALTVTDRLEDGAVRLSNQGIVYYTFAASQGSITIAVREQFIGAYRGPPVNATLLPNPRCPMKAAWKAAGLRAGTLVSVMYLEASPMDGVMWVFDVHGEPLRYVDAMTCAPKR